ncbi:membrane protein [Clostridium carboxidivorans P7]|uniref:YibE/F family protein n=1 Tax=Clostridium carboxidivorans P7 TaxID=536227 RepID=C6PT54_9CLOT|nr:YibE/F family protein [Clostridium carboxidivorans]AKN31824.1 membrane protein [Clostridium carboxidivorans P7]EET87575.1 YibE/F family protein [Clostridium carboxidivorans P7]EFG87340.1 YibE/F-like protein [Clostridium carboxidivorans P7]
MEKVLSLLKKNKFTSIVAISLVFICVIIYCFTSNNENYYDKTIAKITYIKETPSKITNMNGDIEQITKQQIKSIIMNGKFKGQEIGLENSSSYSGVNNLNLKVGDEVFISTQQDANNKITSAKILDLKRDKYVVYITSIFIFLILLVGGFKGFRSLASVIINIIIFCIIIKLFIHGYNLIFISIIASLLFVILSISIVCGTNKKTLSAVLGTIAGTLLSMLIAVFVIQLNHWNGIKFEEMEFLTHPPEQIFYIEILIGTLGSIMDIAISISSSIKELCDKNPNIESKVLINSGKEIGKDIMGTMTNTLVFAYISGSIPLILLLLKNNFSFFYIISINLSLEFVRALTGSIGIILSIPITIYISVILFKNHKIGVF